jgi:hypothetical protein
MPTIAIELPMKEIRRFCEKWRIRELAVFGSILSENFRADSDIDFLYTFDDNCGWDLFDVIDMKQELESLLNREVDFVDREIVEKSPNWARRKLILDSALAVYRETI